MLNSILSVRRKRIYERPANADSSSSERKGFQHVRGAAHPSINVYLEIGVRPQPELLELGDYFDENFDAGGREIELPPAMVGENDAAAACFDCFDGVLPCLYALKDNGHFCYTLEPRDVLP